MSDTPKPETTDPTEGLTDGEREFAHHYTTLRGKRGSITQAAKLAGVDPKWASNQGQRWLKKLRVLAYIQILRDRAAIVTGLDREFVLVELAENLKAAKIANDHGAVNASIRLLGIELGMFTERQRLEDLRKAAPPVERMPMADYMKAVKDAGLGEHADQGGKVVDIKRGT
jgi:hypothetical protein